MVKVNNYAKKVGTLGVERKERNWYQWKIFVDETVEVLDTIESVDYLLHPTFPNPLRTEKDRTTKFAHETAGWGTFLIYVTIHYKDGKEEEVTYLLNFLDKPYPE